MILLGNSGKVIKFSIYFLSNNKLGMDRHFLNRIKGIYKNL